MNQEEKKLIKEFEKEVWLFLDGDLPESRIEFWEIKINEIPELKSCLQEYEGISKLYSTANKIELEEHKFNSMIDVAINTDSFWNKVKNFFTHLFSSESEFVYGKIAFASFLIAAAILVLVLTNRPNPVVQFTEKINNNLLDWNATAVDNKIDEVNNLIKVAKDDDYRKYYKYKFITSDVDKKIEIIDKNIEELKEEINNKNL